jgi:hypothetical protein
VPFSLWIPLSTLIKPVWYTLTHHFSSACFC